MATTPTHLTAIDRRPARGAEREEWAAWCLRRDRAMVRAASRAHAEGRAVQVLALVAPWSPTHGTEYTAAEARRLGLEVTVKRFEEG